MVSMAIATVEVLSAMSRNSFAVSVLGLLIVSHTRGGGIENTAFDIRSHGLRHTTPVPMPD